MHCSNLETRAGCRPKTGLYATTPANTALRGVRGIGCVNLWDARGQLAAGRWLQPTWACISKYPLPASAPRVSLSLRRRDGWS